MAKNTKDPVVVNESNEDAPPPPTLEERNVTALESIATSLQALAMKYVPPETREIAGFSLGRKTCPNGHAMQVDEQYCQHCYRSESRSLRRSTATSITVPPLPPEAAAEPEPPEPTAA